MGVCWEVPLDWTVSDGLGLCAKHERIARLGRRYGDVCRALSPNHRHRCFMDIKHEQPHQTEDGKVKWLDSDPSGPDTK